MSLPEFRRIRLKVPQLLRNALFPLPSGMAATATVTEEATAVLEEATAVLEEATAVLEEATAEESATKSNCIL